MRSSARAIAAAIVAAAVLGAVAPVLRAQLPQPRTAYTDALAREALLRTELEAHRPEEPSTPLLRRLRVLVGGYEEIARSFPASGYSDNALWQAAVLSADAFWQFGDRADRDAALRLFDLLAARFPGSSLAPRVPAHMKRLNAVRTPNAGAVSAGAAGSGAALLKAIRRDVLPDALRVTLELEREVAFQSERLDGPPRVFVDLLNTRAVDALKDAVIPFSDDLVKQVRVGRQLDSRTRVVLDLQSAGRHSVYTLYNPYRVVIDFERAPAPPTPAREAKAPAAAPAAPPGAADTKAPGATWADTPLPAAPPSRNANSFSLSRQLGLGVARIVIDPGHGGRDPGAEVKGLSEADLTLDVALRLEKLLLKQPGVEVVLTRRGSTYVSLEERTAIANREGADLFLSIHANASANASVGGVETYFLNFAPNAAAEAIAARENASSARTMRHLPDIVRAIALNNKIDESRDFAALVQASLYDRLRKVNKGVRNLGVKQAPFMVLVGATMPSILAEISFLTNRQEANLLKTEKYRQQIAEALLAGVMRYQESLKKVPAVAAQ